MVWLKSRVKTVTFKKLQFGIKYFKEIVKMDWYRFQKEEKGEKRKGIKKRIRS